jgi:hypothetical protein
VLPPDLQEVIKVVKEQHVDDCKAGGGSYDKQLNKGLAVHSAAVAGLSKHTTARQASTEAANLVIHRLTVARCMQAMNPKDRTSC